MKPWQVEFLLAPRSAPTAAWSPALPLPRDFIDRLATLGLAPPASPAATGQSWGKEDGNRVDVRQLANGRQTVRVAVDTRQLDPRFAAALLALVRGVNGVLVRADGLVIDGTVGAFSSALRSAPAWRFVSDPTGLLTGRPAMDDEDDPPGAE